MSPYEKRNTQAFQRAKKKYAQSERGKEQQREQSRKYNESPRGRFSQQRRKAKRRGIEWLLTFDEWWAIWKDGWEHRGRSQGQLVMARHGDIGPYSSDNVKLITCGENVSEYKRL